jgi:hypothetical protein
VPRNKWAWFASPQNVVIQVIQFRLFNPVLPVVDAVQRGAISIRTLEVLKASPKFEYFLYLTVLV